MPAVLIVEDSNVVLKVLKHLASRLLAFDLVFATPRADALHEMQKRDDWLAAVVDLTLPDAHDGELVDDVLAQGIPTIVLTASFSDEKRDKLTKKGIVDYVLKEGRFSYQYAINLVNRLYKNKSIKVLVAEDSRTTRHIIRELLQRHQFQVFEAEDGAQALEIFQQNPDIKLLLTDYNMPKMDGFELIHELRQRHEKMELVIIGLSSEGDTRLSAKFIKHGANDFLHKPFSEEEFFCRIVQDVESLELMEKLHDLAYQDYLTGVANRRAFFEQGIVALEQASNDETPIALAQIDIDLFKKVNDTYGHDAGDAVLVAFSEQLKNTFKRFLVARTGGEEFTILMKGLSNEQAFRLLDTFRNHVEMENVAITPDTSLSYTFSAGVTNQKTESIEQLMKTADEYLYRAKEAGRNMVVGDD